MSPVILASPGVVRATDLSLGHHFGWLHYLRIGKYGISLAYAKCRKGCAFTTGLGTGLSRPANRRVAGQPPSSVTPPRSANFQGDKKDHSQHKEDGLKYKANNDDSNNYRGDFHHAPYRDSCVCL
jgi:hypothetical protein